MYVYNVATGQYIASLSQVAADEFLEVGVGPGQYIVEFSGNVSEDELWANTGSFVKFPNPVRSKGRNVQGLLCFPILRLVSCRSERLGDAPQPIEIYDLRGSLVWEGSAQGQSPLTWGR